MGRDRTLRLATALTVALFVSPRRAAADFIVRKSSLKIRDPEPLRGAYESAIGDFGVPKYGGSLVGEIVYNSADPEGCKKMVDVPKARASGRATIMLLDRGNCFFLEKAFAAQEAGADAVLIADNEEQPLMTMAEPADDADVDALEDKLWIPGALVSKEVGDMIKRALVGPGGSRRTVVAEMDWSDAIPESAGAVEWQLWGTTNPSCGAPCERLQRFIKEFQNTAQQLEASNSTSFTPHFVSYSCANSDRASADCASQCINRGRYCAPDPGENLRQLCLSQRVAGQGMAWLWWRFAALFADRCQMAQGQFTAACSYAAMAALGLPPSDVAAVKRCVGDVAADRRNAAMEAEQAAQDDADGAGTVMLLPTVIVDGVQYRGRLDASSVLRGICAGFQEAAEPAVCLSGAMEPNECAQPGNGGCWSGPVGYNFSACVDTFRGHVCRCPAGFVGDGYDCQDIDECAVAADAAADEAAESSDESTTAGALLGSTSDSTSDSTDGSEDPEGAAIAAKDSSGSTSDSNSGPTSDSTTSSAAGGYGGICDETCTNTVGGFKCSCSPPYRLVGERYCVFVDKCRESFNNGGCDHSCAPTQQGGVKCGCYGGFQLAPDGKTCLAAPAPPRYPPLPASADDAAAAAAAGQTEVRPGRRGLSAGDVIAIVLVVLAGTALALVIIYKICLRAAMSREIRQILHEYIPLQNAKDGLLDGKNLLDSALSPLTSPRRTDTAERNSASVLPQREYSPPQPPPQSGGYAPHNDF